MADRVLQAPNVQVHWNKQVVDVIGETTIESIELEDTRAAQPSFLDSRGKT